MLTFLANIASFLLAIVIASGVGVVVFFKDIKAGFFPHLGFVTLAFLGTLGIVFKFTKEILCPLKKIPQEQGA